MKKILILNKYYHPKIGGIEKVVKQHAEALRENGYEVDVLCCHESILKSEKLNIRSVNIFKKTTLFELFSMPVSLSFIFFFLMNYKKYDFIYIHEPFPLATVLAFFLKKNIKTIVYYHSQIVKQKLIKRLFEYMQQSYFASAKIVFTSSPNMHKYSPIIKNLQNVKISPIWVDTKEVNQVKKTEILEKTKDFYFFLGRNSYYKGITILMQAIEIYFKKGGKYNFVIAGDNFKMSFHDEFKTRVLLVKKSINEKEKYSYLRSARSFLFPSIEVSEAFGIVQVEAMSQGTPVINTSLKSGVPWVSLHKITGLTVGAKNPKELAEAILKMDSETLITKYGISAYRRYRDVFSEDSCKPQLIGYFDEI